jgi:hypothetical protein
MMMGAHNSHQAQAPPPTAAAATGGTVKKVKKMKTFRPPKHKAETR